jgi:tetratricopeptide (TPR) repeat protein
MRSTLRWYRVCGALGAAGLAMPAAAQTLKETPAVLNKQDAAAQHFQLGVEFYRAGDYAAARVEFEAAFGLSRLPDLLHNLSLTTEKQGQIRAAIEYEEHFLAAKRSEQTTTEIDEARGRLLRLREQQNHGPQTAPTVPAVAAVASPSPARGVEPTAPGWRPPAGALALLVGGGAALVAGLACGGAALATGSQLGSGQAFTLREIDALTTQGNALNASAIALDIAGGVALTAGATWTIVT